MSWASRTTGTMSPRGVAAAMPRFTCSWWTIWPVSSSQLALTTGVRRMARVTALHHTVSGETRSPRKARSARSRATRSIVGVTSQVRKAVTSALVSMDVLTASAVTLRTPWMGTRRSPGAVGSPPSMVREIHDWAKSWVSPLVWAGMTGWGVESVVFRSAGSLPAACLTSVRVMTPSRPVPVTVVRSTPSSAASRRAGGLASTCSGPVLASMRGGFDGSGWGAVPCAWGSASRSGETALRSCPAGAEGDVAPSWCPWLADPSAAAGRSSEPAD